jgi:hypothetical protein
MRTTKNLAFLAAAMSLAGAGQAAVFEFNSLNAEIPDGTGTVLVNSQLISTSITSLQELRVTLNISGTEPGGAGGYNGDLYAALRFNDTLAVLINRPGVGVSGADTFGYSDSGFNVTFADSAIHGDIHTYRFSLFGDHTTSLSGPLTGTWAPDGRNVDPLFVMDALPRDAMLSVFSGINPNGTWQLLLSDEIPGGISRLDSWSLELVPVPEPHEYALLTGALLLGFALFRSRNSLLGRSSIP